MTEEQKNKLHDLCQSYGWSKLSDSAHWKYLTICDYVETLIDEAVKDAITAQKADKE